MVVDVVAAMDKPPPRLQAFLVDILVSLGSQQGSYGFIFVSVLGTGVLCVLDCHRLFEASTVLGSRIRS